MDDRRRVSITQEKSAARALGARQHKGSGSGNKRLDMHTEGELIECKTVLRGNKSITLKSTDLRLLSHQAALQDLNPVMHVRLDGRDWVLIPEGDYVELKSLRPDKRTT